MSLSKKLAVATLSGALATGTLLATNGRADAQSFLDRMFNPKCYDNNGSRKAQKPAVVEQPVERKPIRISAPRFYTYKANALTSVSLAALATVALPSAKEAASEGAASDDALVTGTTPAAIEGTATEGVSAAVLTEARPASAMVYADTRGFLADMKIRTYPEIAKAIIAHYTRTGEAIWISEDGVTDKARAAIAILEKADRVGLSPADYHVSMPERVAALATHVAVAEGDVLNDAPVLSDSPENAGKKALIAFEMELSAKVLTYVLDATRGRVDPNRLSGYHDLPLKKVDLAAALDALAASDDAAAYLESRNPSGEHFKRLVAERERLLSAEQGERIVIADGTLLKPGQSNPELANIIAGIRLRGSEELKEKHAETLAAYTGGEEYTPELEALVRDFQREKKLAVDGIVGRGTIRILVGDSNEAKLEKIDLAMERARWLPGDLGNRYVFVNQPAYKVSYVRPDAAPLTMRVVIGRPSNQTSFFMDKLETVEFNPYWGVPLSIIVNEMMPKLNKDPSYLDRAGYEVTTASGRPVSSASVDWHSVASRSTPINVRQRPGRSNALGEVKILFPNKHAIYMHDTPAKNLFGRDMRAYSHGCIRLQDPRAMAAAVLGKPKDYIASRIAEGQNDSDPVTLDIPIYISYFTAWPDADGTVRYFDDVYKRDSYLQKAIAVTEKARQG